VRQWFRLQARDTSVAQGREILERELKRLGSESKRVQEVARLFDYDDPSDFLAALGFGDLSVARLASRLLEAERTATPPPLPPTETPEERKSPTGVKIGELGDILSIPARCCNPVPGDPVVGYVTRGRGLTIHRKDCPNLRNFPEPERLMPLDWSAEVGESYAATIRVVATDRAGLLRDIAEVITAEGINVTSAKLTTIKDDRTAQIDATLEIRSSDQLVRLLNRLERLPYVLSARRMRA
jgi:GTP pyrophosphokinase